jgi:CubicO group peptidase (beta-lactamase class C family)
MDAFRANFDQRNDLGAACAVYRDGRPVVDIWAGTADRRHDAPWGRDTSAVIFSCSKGIVAICLYLLVQQGRLDLDRPIAELWPEFAKGGKQRITVRDAMAHRSGVAALDADLTLDQVLAWDPVIHAIETHEAAHQPEEGHFYHAMTYGWVLGEVIRRVTSLTPGRFFRQEVGDPLDLDTWIGLPLERQRTVAWMESPLPDEDTPLARDAARAFDANPAVERSATMGGAYAFPAVDGYVTFNDPRIRAAEIPGANGISTARSLAKLYAACIDPIDDIRLLTDASILDATRLRSAGPQLSGLPDDGGRWGSGFQLASLPYVPMLGPSSFGHAGAGGQLAFGDAERHVAFAYLGNQMGGFGDRRARELTVALARCLPGS